MMQCIPPLVNFVSEATTVDPLCRQWTEYADTKGRIPLFPIPEKYGNQANGHRYCRESHGI